MAPQRGSRVTRRRLQAARLARGRAAGALGERMKSLIWMQFRCGRPPSRGPQRGYPLWETESLGGEQARLAREAPTPRFGGAQLESASPPSHVHQRGHGETWCPGCGLWEEAALRGQDRAAASTRS